jgi:hypothetical protein
MVMLLFGFTSANIVQRVEDAKFCPLKQFFSKISFIPFTFGDKVHEISGVNGEGYGYVSLRFFCVGNCFQNTDIQYVAGEGCSEG